MEWVLMMMYVGDAWAMERITCIKGKLIKKISAINPKCPSGYKKVNQR